VLLSGLPGSGVEALHSALNRHPELWAETVDPRRFVHATARAPLAAVVRVHRDVEDAAVVAYFRPHTTWPREWPALRAALDTAADILADHTSPGLAWSDLARAPESALRLVLARLGRPWHEECLAVLRRELDAELADQPTGGPGAYARFYRSEGGHAAPVVAMGA